MRQGRRVRLAIFSLATILGLGTLAAFNATATAADDENPQVVLDTTKGPITIELDKARAPITVENFLKYVDSGFYDNTVFHRVIPGFMIQGGGMTDKLEEKPTKPPIKNESGNGLSNNRGTIAMARTNNPDSATSQFFINHNNNPDLDTYGGGYAVFGKVVSGMETVDAIAKVQTGNQSIHQNVPLKPIYIKSAKRKAKS
ncbi:peptidylprolyl isomerase [Singulisphaera sp. PoT]|uniref:peptidylprolyl isomerase n=1 Tax=Singulisphaera sp. PoT TaxID=3411797 RepID=UPI003BF50C07